MGGIALDPGIIEKRFLIVPRKPVRFLGCVARPIGAVLALMVRARGPASSAGAVGVRKASRASIERV